MSNDQAAMVIRGVLIHTSIFGEVEIITDAADAVDGDGQISSVVRTVSKAYKDLLHTATASGGSVELRNSQYLLPSLLKCEASIGHSAQTLSRHSRTLCKVRT